ncbi:MAG: tetratricopeptide repeat protein [Polyangiaceae bacterium]|nr:tetratricopeptide repeat protein [Polyangiaceae bacterium]
MQHLFQDVVKRLQAFLAQKKTFLLLTRCRDEDTAMLFKALESVDEMDSDIFWVFHEDFTDPKTYANSVVESFQKQAETLSKELEDSGEPSWPPLPPQLTNPMTPPTERLRLLAMYARTRIPNMEAAHCTIALVPIRILQPLEWRAFVHEFMKYDPESPWCHHMRFIMREPSHLSMDKLSPERKAKLDPNAFPNTEIYSIDFSQEALQKAMRDELADPTIPLPQRMQYLLMDAAIDYAHKRYLEAGEKYQLLRKYYTRTKNPTLLAIALNGIGEVHAAASPGLREKAVEYFEMAATTAVEAECSPVLLNVMLNLGNLYLANHKWTQATEHFEAAGELAPLLSNAGAMLLSLENIGVCRYKLEEWGPAQKAWQDGLELARATKDDNARKKMLVHLRDMYKTARMHDRLAATEEELRSLQ